MLLISSTTKKQMLLILVTHDDFPMSADCVSFFRFLPLYFPWDKHEEDIAALKLPADVGDENGETVIDERKIRIKPLPAGDGKAPIPALAYIPLPDSGLMKRMRWVYKCMYFFSVLLAERNYLKERYSLYAW
jgi:hypothetical protein